MKRIAVIGDCNSIFVKNYIDTVLVGEYEVILVEENPLSDVYRKYYERHGVKVEPLYSGVGSLIRRVPYIRSTIGCRLWVRQMVKKYGHFDFVHIHGVCNSRQTIGEALRPHTTKLIVSVWGDELLRRSARQLKSISRLYDIADSITLVNKMIKLFEEVYGKKYSGKISKNSFAVSTVTDAMDELEKKETREDMCRSLGITDSDKINVYVGHNGRPQQRHIEITEQMKKLPFGVKSKINLVYSMNYGSNPKSFEAVVNAASNSGCPYTIIQGYRSEEDVARMRLVCDVLLHAQLTDAGSASVRETLYSGAIVVNGDWLPYNNIPNYHDRVIEYHEMSELTDIVVDIVNNFDSYKERFVLNKGFRYWTPKETVAEAWKKLLK